MPPFLLFRQSDELDAYLRRQAASLTEMCDFERALHASKQRRAAHVDLADQSDHFDEK